MQMQTQQQLSFFKLPQQSHTTRSDCSSRRNVRQHHPLHQLQNKQHQISFKPPSSQQQLQEQEQHEVQQQGQRDRLSALYSRLQQEAEKIRKWKNATELELKQKDRQLNDTQHLLESKQCSLLEAQMLNESLSTRLQDELSNQKEIQRKIQSTRDMCHALKEHVGRVEEGLALGESDRNSLRGLNQHRITDYQKLLEQFVGLEQQQAVTQSIVQEAVLVERARNAELVKELELQALQNSSQLTELQQELNGFKQQVVQLSADIDSSTQLIATMTKQQGALEDKHQLKCEELSTKQQELHECNMKLKEMEDKSVLLDTELHTSKEEIQHMKDQIQDQEHRYQSAEEKHEQQMNQVQQQLAQLNLTIDERDSSLNQRDAELIKAKKETSLANNDCQELKEQLTQSNVQCGALKEEVSRAQTSLEQLQHQHKSALDELAQCKERATGMQKLLEQKEKDNENTYHKMISQLEEEQSKVKHLTEQASQHREEIASLQAQNNDLQAELSTSNQSLLESNNKLDNVERELSESVSLSNSLRSQLKALQDSLTSSTASGLSLEAQVRGLTDKLQSQYDTVEAMKEQSLVSESELKSRNDALAVLGSEVEKLKLELSQLEQGKSDAIDSLKEECALKQTKYQEVQSQLVILTTELNKASQREQDAKTSCAVQIREACAALEKYKEENSNAVALKDKEFQSVQQQQALDLLERNKLQKELEQAREKLQHMSSEKENAEEHLSLANKKLGDTKDQIKLKDEEIKDLLEVVSRLQPKPMSPPSKSTPSHTGTLDSETPISTPLLRNIAAKRQLSACRTRSIPRGGSKTEPLAVLTTPHTTLSQQSSGIVSNTTRSIGRARKTTQDDSTAKCEQVKLQFKQLYPDVVMEDEAIFKKPRNKAATKANTTRSKSSSVKRGSVASRKGGKSKTSTQTAKDNNELSWFDLDPVFGFGPED